MTAYRQGNILIISLLGLLLTLPAGAICAETLNPGNVNPHAEAPRKRITIEQKKAAAEAMKKKKAEIEARKAQRTGAQPSSEPTGKQAQ